MRLNVDVSRESGAYVKDVNIDIGDLYELHWVLSQSDLELAIKLAVAQVAIENETSYDNVTPDFVEDVEGDTLSVASEYWLPELAQFAWHLFSFYPNDEDAHLKFFAHVQNQGWEYYDFDDLKSAEQDFYAVESDLDAEEYARKEMSDNGESLDEHLEKYFDYEEYGKDLLDDFDQVEYGGRTYLFTQ